MTNPIPISPQIEPIKPAGGIEDADITADVESGDKKIKIHFNIVYVVLAIIGLLIVVAGLLIALEYTGVIDDIVRAITHRRIK